ncbi:type III PLP-dependent enzyme [Aeromonas allosaccharophila]|uniref:type III PLP-dependent enzyme n=1 Tax=Aeromonas allosaccharophila TaxID=656 RepID=UPI003D22BECB
MNETLVAKDVVAQDYRQLVEQFGSPLLLLDKAAVRKQYRALAAALPDVRLHYALKPLPHEAVVSVLKEEGACFDLATNGEVDLVRSQGVRPGRCIHTHPIKRDSDICYALEFGCTVFVYDNPLELEKFIPYKDEVKLLLRVSFPNPETKVDLSKKFGCTPEQALPLLQLAHAKGIKVMGLSFHVGSQVPHARRHVQAIDACREIMEQAWALGLKPWVLDIGGGFPVDYEGGEFDIDGFCAPIREALAKLPATVQKIAEPGRFISAPAMTSVSSVMGKAHRGDKIWYYLDDGLYGSYNGQLYDHVTYPVSTPYASGEQHNSVLSGPTCDSVDVIREGIMLPDLAIGELVIGKVMGAYTWASASTFNFFPKASILILDSSQQGQKLVAVA